MRRLVVFIFILALIALASVVLSTPTNAQSGCGLQPLKPLAPLGCKDLVAECRCAKDENGRLRCHWEWQCVQSQSTQLPPTTGTESGSAAGISRSLREYGAQVGAIQADTAKQVGDLQIAAAEARAAGIQQQGDILRGMVESLSALAADYLREQQEESARKADREPPLSAEQILAIQTAFQARCRELYVDQAVAAKFTPDLMRKTAASPQYASVREGCLKYGYWNAPQQEIASAEEDADYLRALCRLRYRTDTAKPLPDDAPDAAKRWAKILPFLTPITPPKEDCQALGFWNSGTP